MNSTSPTLGSRLYGAFYNFIRKTPALNHLAHKMMQSEAIYHMPPYRKIYQELVERKARQYMRVPPFIEMTITDACNARCIMCPPEVHLGKTIMAQELFERICLEAEALGIRKMIITGGEPLLDRNIFDKIRFAKAHGFTYVHMFTNGSLMNEKIARKIIATGLDSLTWSIDSARKEEYEQIRINLKFDQVIANIRRFMEIRQEMGWQTPLTRVNMVTLSENQDSRREFRKFFGKFVDIVEIIDSHNFAGSQTNLTTDAAHEYHQTTRYPCHLLFSKAVVFSNGFLKKCSIDYATHAIIGDLKKQSLQEILQSKRMLSLKEAHLKQEFNEPGCDICTYKESWWVNY
ncbi:MAG: radical SAM protein [Anaerolineae bacterium]|nr:radical SAM protein [Anaerolineae bacterium]